MHPGVGDDTLLRPPALMEVSDLTRAYSLFGGNDLECIPDSMGWNNPVRIGTAILIMSFYGVFVDSHA